MTSLHRGVAGGAALVAVLGLAVTSCSDTTVTAVEVHSVTLSPSQVTVGIGDTVRLQATVRDASGNVLTDRPLTWNSEDSDIATVEGGLVRGMGPGTVPIRASSGGAAGQSSVTVTAPSSIVLSRNALAFQAMSGSGPTDAQQVGITNGGEAPLTGLQTTVTYASGDTGWLEAELDGTTAPTELSIRADASDLPAGTYEADVEVISAGADNSPQVIEVTFEVATAPPTVRLDPDLVVFAVAEGEGSPQPQVVDVTNIGDGELTGLEASITYAEGEPTGWLDAELAGTTVPTELTLRVDPAGLPSPNVFDAVVEVTSPDAESPASVEVRFTLGEPPPEIELDPTEIAWDIVEDDATPPTREVRIDNRGTGTLGGLSATIEYGPEANGWLAVALGSDVAPTDLTASLSTTDLLPGEYTATIEVSGEAINSPQEVAVSLTVAARASPQTSSIATSHEERVANGSSAAVITVELRDARGGAMPAGGDDVDLDTDIGSVSAVTDEGDGTYTATLTSTAAGTATVTGTVNGEAIDDDAVVEFVAGPPAAVEVVSGDGQSAVVGTALPDPLQVRVVDANDNPVGGVTVNWDTDDGAPGAASSSTNTEGLASTTWTLGTTAGDQSLVASVSEATSATFDATGLPGPPDGIFIFAGNDQSGVVGEELDEALVVEVRDEHGNPVGAGVSVSWQAADGGSADPTTSETGANGRATTAWTLGPALGDQTLDASVEDVGSVTFDATAGAGPPAEMVIVGGDGQTGTVGEALAEALEVEVSDALGNPVSGVTVTWAPASGSGSAAPTASPTNASGVATTTWTLGSTPGEKTLVASVDGVDPVTFDATAEAGDPEILDMVDGDEQTGTVGEALDDPLEVEVTDALGNPLSGVTVTWTPAPGDGTASPTTSPTNASGIASTTWTLGSASGGHTLVASAPGLDPVTFTATATAGPPDDIAIAGGDGQAGAVGEPLGDPLQVVVTDALGNPVSGVTVTWNPAPGDGSAAPPTSPTNASGIASTTWTLGGTLGLQILDASVADVGSVQFDATAEAGAAENVDIASGNEQTGTVGEDLADPLEVEVTDALGNPVSDVSVSWSPSGGGIASPTSSDTDGSGIASTIWTLGPSPGSQTMDASVTGVGSVQFAATAEEGDPDAVAIADGNNQTGTVGEALAALLEVEVTDALGNPLSGVPVSWAPSGDGGASPPSSPTDGSGIASTTWTLGTSAGEQTLDAIVSGLDPATFTATAQAGDPASFTIASGDGQTGTVSTPLAELLVVEITDALGNPVSGVTVTWAPGEGTVTSTTTDTDGDGRATTSWTLGPTAGEQTLVASAAGLADVTFTATAEADDLAQVVIETSNPLSFEVTDPSE